ncbi:hypothetical protein Q644_11045 [Brucella intermedia 229E]|uniref:Uncharacterized protein n=1 Tax=Brucella intermedia 229E TaxID=1337887 RepID=U4VED9_9HYPH|nr:hypothetical protein Q644_11045 [Brucella intermedia 229E]
MNMKKSVILNVNIAESNILWCNISSTIWSYADLKLKDIQSRFNKYVLYFLPLMI